MAEWSRPQDDAIAAAEFVPGSLEAAMHGADQDRRSLLRRAHRSAEKEAHLLEAPRYAAEVNSIPRTMREELLAKASTPLLTREVFLRRRNLVVHDLHVLLVSDSLTERYQVRARLLDLGYIVTNCPSGKEAKAMLERQASEFHIVMIDAKLQTGAEGPGVHGLLYWARNIPTFSEVAFIIMAPTTLDLSTSTLFMKLGASDLIAKPISKDGLFKLRKIVGDAQNMQYQRNTRKATGGTRLVTTLLGKREWLQRERMQALEEVEEEAGGAKAKIRELHGTKKDDVDLRATYGTLLVLLLHLAGTPKELERRDAVRAMLKDCGYQVVTAKNVRDAMAALSAEGVEWAMLLLDFKYDFSMGVAMLKEMANRQILLPVVGLHEDRSLEMIVRTMKAGVCDVIVFPFTRAQLKGLTKYLLTASERIFLQDQAKRIAVILDTERQQRALQAKHQPSGGGGVLSTAGVGKDGMGAQGGAASRRRTTHTGAFLGGSIHQGNLRDQRGMPPGAKLAAAKAPAAAPPRRSAEVGASASNHRRAERLVPPSRDEVEQMLDAARLRETERGSEQSEWESGATGSSPQPSRSSPPASRSSRQPSRSSRQPSRSSRQPSRSPPPRFGGKPATAHTPPRVGAEVERS